MIPWLPLLFERMSRNFLMCSAVSISSATIFVFDQHAWHDRTAINGLRSVMLMNHKNSCP
ncbi:hypothetical protein MOO00_20460 [Escherichia coli]|uniref:hypothetical protein n=1 Tax=Escherichia coli TaxID=562 RepID=UPI001FF66670|nr:hypothetical protein [Escherichia coli]MCJ8458231.1 hypothetical protein [Escherichia coli]